MTSYMGTNFASYMGTNFASAFGIRYMNQAGQQELRDTTSWELSTRVIGGVIMTYGDDRAWCCRLDWPPYRVVLVPIAGGETVDTVRKAVRDLARRLKAEGIRAHVDPSPGVAR